MTHVDPGARGEQEKPRPREAHIKIEHGHIPTRGERWWWDCSLCGIGGRMLLSEKSALRGLVQHQHGWRHEYNLAQDQKWVGR